MATSHQGGCLCGWVRFEISSEPIRTLFCRCATCRKAVGATKVAWAVVSLENFKWTGQEPQYFNSSSDVTKSFCPKCGTSLSNSHHAEPQNIDITIAAFDAPEDFKPTLEIWNNQKLLWEVNDLSLEQMFEE